MKKRVFSMIVALVMFIALLPVHALALSGAGSAGDPYVIASAADWDELAAFVAGGGDYGKPEDPRAPFAGGSGAGVSLQPVGFLVLGPDGVHMLPAQNLLPWEHTIAMLPRLIADIKAIFPPEEEPQNGMTACPGAKQ